MASKVEIPLQNHANAPRDGYASGHANQRLNPRILNRDGRGANIVFYGCGRIVERTIDHFFPQRCEETPRDSEAEQHGINKIYLLGTKEGFQRRCVMAMHTQESTDSRRSTIEILAGEETLFPDIIQDIDLLFVTGSAHGREPISREEMFKRNLHIIEALSKYITPEFPGIINIVSNLPEGLAHYAQTCLRVADRRQIVAGVPLDARRIRTIIKDLLRFMPIEDVDCTVLGYHDRPYPMINGSRMRIEGSIEWKPLEEQLRRISNIEDLIIKLEKFGSEESRMRRNSAALSHREVEGAPTEGPTARAILEFISAVIHGSKTHTAIPYCSRIDDKWYYTYLPVDFSTGLPQVDAERIARLIHENDIVELDKRICGVPCDPRIKPLRDVLAEVLGDESRYRFDMKPAFIQGSSKGYNFGWFYNAKVERCINEYSWDISICAGEKRNIRYHINASSCDEKRAIAAENIGDVISYIASRVKTRNAGDARTLAVFKKAIPECRYIVINERRMYNPAEKFSEAMANSEIGDSLRMIMRIV